MQRHPQTASVENCTDHRFQIWLYPVPCWHRQHLTGWEGSAAWGLLPAPDAVAPSVLKLFILRPFSIAHLPCATSQLRAQQCPLPGVLCKGVALPIYHGPCMCSGKSQ